MKRYEVFMGATSCIEVARREISDKDDIPNLQDEDVVYPCDLGDGSDVCMVPHTAQIWFVDEDGNEVKRLSLDPAERNGINYVDGGEIFDESNLDKSYFYFELPREDAEWSCGTIKTDEVIAPEKITITIKSYVDGGNQKRILIDPSTLKFAGLALCCDCIGDDGTNGKSFWVLHNGKRKSIDVETAEV